MPKRQAPGTPGAQSRPRVSAATTAGASTVDASTTDPSSAVPPNGDDGSAQSSVVVAPPVVASPDKLADAAVSALAARLSRVAIQQHLDAQFAIAKLPPLTGVAIWTDLIYPSPVVENRPALAYFLVYNGTLETQPAGLVSAEVQPLHSLSPTSADTSFQIPKLEPFDMAAGVLSFTAPRSDIGNVLTVNYGIFGPAAEPVAAETVLATATRHFDVAGRYMLRTNQVSISDTASRISDTLYMALAGICGDVSSKEQEYLGDHDNGTFGVDFVGLGPFDSLPGISPEAIITYVLINNGHSDDANKVLNDVSDLSAAVVTAVATILYGPVGGAAAGAVSAAVDSLMHLFHDNLFKDCDCMLVDSQQVFTSQQLYDMTFDPADALSRHQGWDSQEGGSPCDHWRYKVGWEIERLRAPSDVAWITPRYVAVPFGATVGLTAADMQGGPLGRVGWKWDVIAGEGRVDEAGQFKAPDARQYYDNYAVIRAERLGSQDGKVKSTGYAIVQFI